ncbi:RNA polymerase sigma-70 factor [Dyadobacter sp. CY347]|uniref:RNA polymerase sigma-70 factor n=1 Tax=Dyadobacter sp. CY347 TaxID=2909336 RepID=UPI001F2B68C7|nr:RNA polymerase sigma-70 factor [Dyadobacter sp. CY347]MCF2488106.1 RNA polymerase sigma-70 factor [Dyadobacter sp. CY347]
MESKTGLHMIGITSLDSSDNGGEERALKAAGAEATPDEGLNGLADTEFFIRRTFETDVQKGCELLFQRYYKPMCSHAVRFVYSKDIAEDIVADIFCNFWDNQIHRAVNVSYGAYLFRSVRNRCFNYLQKEQNKTLPLDATVENDPLVSHLPEKMMQYEELYQQVNTLVQGLPPQCQKVFVMNRFEGKAGKEIAMELNLSTRTVEAHISKALNVIRHGLRHYWVESVLLFIIPFCQNLK